MTLAPKALASWIAVVPMPDEPPCTSSVSPAFSPPRSNTLCQTVKKVSGSAAGLGQVKPAGTGSALLSCTDAIFGIAAAGDSAQTWSPSFQRVDAGPSAATSPATSRPGQVGGAGRRRIGALALQHVGPVDAGGRDPDQDLAVARARHGRCSGFSTCGPPGSRIAIAVISAGSVGMVTVL